MGIKTTAQRILEAETGEAFAASKLIRLEDAEDCCSAHEQMAHQIALGIFQKLWAKAVEEFGKGAFEAGASAQVSPGVLTPLILAIFKSVGIPAPARLMPSPIEIDLPGHLGGRVQSGYERLGFLDIDQAGSLLRAAQQAAQSISRRGRKRCLWGKSLPQDSARRWITNTHQTRR